ncbi:MAG: TlpA family protein disulfide reductase [Schleiferiaceae bacterium]|jgi:thiol-disulfide isomerase/thioredoxin|nr:TlpA family protein disulfide reductase [Schleiferiaceae bacterium]
MKKLVLAAMVLFTAMSFAQNSLPKIQVTTTDGKAINTSTFSNEGKPIVISFWATWCKPCMRELDAISEIYEDWQDEIGMKLIAVSIDDARNSGKVGPLATTKGWEYEIYIDENQDFKRGMGVNNIPHTFVLDGNGNVVWQHTGYALGDEDELYEVLEKVAAGESVE